jgi:hypothetical protein
MDAYRSTATFLCIYTPYCWNRQPEKGNVNPRKEISYCGITICRTYIVLINIGDDRLSLLRLPPLNKFCQPTLLLGSDRSLGGDDLHREDSDTHVYHKVV